MTEISGQSIVTIDAAQGSIDGQNVDIMTLMMMLQMERAETINTQLMDQANEMKNKNALLKEAQNVLMAMRQARPAKSSGKAEVTAEMKAFASAYGIDIKTGNINQSEWDQNIENIKGFIDSTNSSSQLDMIRLQGLTSKYNNAFETMTNLVKKDGDLKSTITRNI